MIIHQVKRKKNIFFLETSCTSSQKGKIYLSPRQACAVESAARMNPDMEVYLLFASPGVIKDEHSESDRMLKVLSEYHNVKLMHFNLKRYVQDTKVEGLWVNGDIQNSNYPITHASDILRFLTLWKYGGIYLDLDVIVTKNLSTLPENFAGVEDNYLGSAALGFGLHQSGREYINDCLEELSTNFDGKNWGNNGPHLITRVMFRRCSQFKQELLIRMGSCEDFVFLPPSAFYLLPYYLWNMYFEEKYKDALMSYVEKSSYLVHIWNKLSVDTPIPKENVNVPYLSFAMKYCPGVVSQIDTVF